MWPLGYTISESTTFKKYQLVEAAVTINVFVHVRQIPRASHRDSEMLTCDSPKELVLPAHNNLRTNKRKLTFDDATPRINNGVQHRGLNVFKTMKYSHLYEFGCLSRVL